MDLLNQRLILALSGFTPNNLGLYTYILNCSGLYITEQAIKDNISEGIYDFERRHTPIQKAVLATAVREIINKIGHRIKPRIQDIRDSLYRINELLGTEHDRVVLNKMARYIFYDWESIIKTPEEGRPHILDFIDMHAVDLDELELADIR